MDKDYPDAKMNMEKPKGSLRIQEERMHLDLLCYVSGKRRTDKFAFCLTGGESFSRCRANLST